MYLIIMERNVLIPQTYGRSGGDFMAKKGASEAGSESTKGKMCCSGQSYGWILLVIGIIYLLQDYGVAVSFWKVSWWTAAFVLIGLKKMKPCCH